MVGLLRRLTGSRRIGHAGTLDPLASGVLPILVGGATRFSEELTGGPKRYDAVIRLGATSATDDGEGPILPGVGPSLTSRPFARRWTTFVGTFDQLPPAYSARKQGGRTPRIGPRAPATLVLAPRQVTVHALDLQSITRDPATADVAIDLRCGPGTYVRSIARDLGAGTGLRRVPARAATHRGSRAPRGGRGEPRAAGGAADGGRLADALLPVADLLPLPRVHLTEADATRFRNGSRIA